MKLGTVGNFCIPRFIDGVHTSFHVIEELGRISKIFSPGQSQRWSHVTLVMSAREYGCISLFHSWLSPQSPPDVWNISHCSHSSCASAFSCCRPSFYALLRTDIARPLRPLPKSVPPSHRKMIVLDSYNDHARGRAGALEGLLPSCPRSMSRPRFCCDKSWRTSLDALRESFRTSPSFSLALNAHDSTLSGVSSC